MCSLDAEDDPFQFDDFDQSPANPIRNYVHSSSYGPIVNSLDREREASILSTLHREQGKLLERRASDEAASVTVGAGLPQSKVGGPTSSSSISLPTFSASAASVLPIGAKAVASIPTPPRRILKREHSALTDKDVLELPYVPKRRRILSKTSKTGPEWPTAPRPENDLSGGAATTEAELSSVYPLPITTGTLDSNSDIL